ncbi:unnamed protein product, partial [marine sediment metagenome]
SLQEAQHALALDYGYRNWTDLTNRAAALGKANTSQGDAASIEGEPDAGDQQTIEFVGNVLSESVKARASDIHIEPYRGSLRIRYRVDGVLKDLYSLPESVEPTIIARIKVMADMDTSEVRLPQDSRFHIKIGEQEVDVRVSTIPTAVGERVVLRLIPKSIAPFKFSDLGLLPEQQEQLKEMLSSPNGIILVTGPTGCGKTTTLHAMLASVNTPGINALTIEDPVEYLIDGVSQIQVNPKIDLTFANGLRSIVRQDPDVILIGEIRDRETAEIAVQAALTGHLVLSALHTSDSASTVTRLVN